MQEQEIVEIKSNIITQRASWLAAKGFTIRFVSDSLDEDYNTVYRWFKNGVVPRRKSLRNLLRKYPDFPVS